MRLQQLDMDKKYLVIVTERDGYTHGNKTDEIKVDISRSLRELGMPDDNFSVLVGEGFDLMFVEATENGSAEKGG